MTKLSVPEIKDIVDDIPCPICSGQPEEPCVKVGDKEMIWGFHTERVVIALAEEVFTLKRQVNGEELAASEVMPQEERSEQPASEEVAPLDE